ncbi:hypothetical protein MPTK1_6g21060 [Marchantia polymorpha subsp. ruderalis]|uniref:Uncharacterized protein n=2 Tax=Marchantia polymorpha TaxID=3197 RepID=A0AAF6BUD9_MARPO|nr:hypothetical protein MARPO_0091s0049 [Marchantia polymorpha]PTQ33194.1 hypothetical protein MARPO_0091s0049 [Marchantia polymorpha]BBN15622.1 hypothetical protein Mp_6g21060 [Marchantia polymorpha subsp. ruderalis]BBN15623.1 hypothetical protein Mp_6g21060 [Marchantia polymorpha subsp. ruderalis]|eukprot:PTQ33193.1 hypothetical protein MARPO_0091s0049 [Marchantia polymorpha]
MFIVKMSQVRGLSSGESQVPKRVWVLGKYAAFAMLLLTALPILIPIGFMLLVITLPLCLPLGCGVGVILCMKRWVKIPRRHQQVLHLSDFVDPCSISPSRSQSSSKSVIARSDADLFVDPETDRHIKEKEKEETGQEETLETPHEQDVKKKPGKTRGGSYMIKLPQSDPGTQVPIAGSQAAQPAGTEGVDSRNAESNRIEIPDAGTGEEQKEVVSATSTGVSSSSGGPTTPEHGHPIPTNLRSHDHVQYVKDDSPRVGRGLFKSRRRKQQNK